MLRGDGACVVMVSDVEMDMEWGRSQAGRRSSMVGGYVERGYCRRLP